MHGKLRFGWLDITNRSLLDAVVYLETVSPEGADISRRGAILVRAGEHGTLGSITSDAYAVFVAQGRQWLGTQRRFALDAHYFMLSDRLNFTEEPTEAGVRLRQFSITLQPVGFGNARTEIINPVNFASRHIPPLRGSPRRQAGRSVRYREPQVIGGTIASAVAATLLLGSFLDRSPLASRSITTSRAEVARAPLPMPGEVYTLRVRPSATPGTPVRQRPPNAPAELRDSTKMFSVCSAAGAAIGARIAAEGDFSSFREIRYKRDALPVIVLHSYAYCTTAGKGSIEAIVWAPEEIERISYAQGWVLTPYGSGRYKVSPPMLLTLEGEVVKVEEGRFTTLQRVIVRRAR